MKNSNILDVPLIALPGGDSVTARDFSAGTFICGMTGGGKTSGPGATILRSFVRAGMGGVITTAKPDDIEMICRICAEEGRVRSLIVWDGTNGGFNVLAWILAYHGPNGVNIAIEFLMRVLEMKRTASATPGGPGDQFWTDAILQRLRNTIPVIYAATKTVRIEDILRFVRSAPQSQAQMKDPDWQRASYFFELFSRAADALDDATGQSALAYWHDDVANLDAKTRGNILISLTTALDALNSGWLRNAFCEETTFVPELCFEGVIIVLDLPVLTRHEEGAFAQQIFIYAFQRAVLQRNALPPRYRARPVFLFIDEFPLFCNSQYADFLGTCRSALCCTVLMAQSLPSLYARMGGPNAQDRAHQLLANCAIKVFGANNCTVSNEWASKTIGRTVHQRGSYNRSEGSNQSFGMNLGEGTNWGTNAGSGSSFSYSSGQGGSGGSWSFGGNSSRGSSQGGSDNRGRNRGHGTNQGESWGYSEQVDWIIEPAEFGRMLKTGGPANRNRVSAIWYQASRQFAASGSNALLAEFRQ